MTEPVRAAAVGRTDLRLAGGAATAWVVTALCTNRPLPLVLAVAALAAVLGGSCAVLARHGLPAAAAPAFAALCVPLVLVPYAGRLVHARASPLVALAAEHAAVTLELVVRGDPHALAAGGVAGTPRVGVDTGATAVLVAPVRHPVYGDVFVLAPAQGWVGLLPGQRLRVDGTLQPALDGGGAVALSVHAAPRLLGRPPWWQRAAGAVRDDLRRACRGLPAAVRGLLPGLVDGDVSAMDPVSTQRFRIAGLTHLTAVSGTNCSILVGTVLLVLGRIGVRRWICAVAGALVVVAFVALARPSPSVLRAAVMAVIALLALGTGRVRQAVPALSAAVLGLLVWNPGLAVNASFVMSVLATAAIVLVAPGWAVALRRRHVPGLLAEGIAVAAAAHAVTAPVIAAISGRVSLVAVPANVLAEPVVAPATVLGFLAALLAPVSMPLGASVAWLAGWPTRWLVWIGDWFGGLHGAALPWPAGLRGAVILLFVVAGLALLARHTGPRRVIAAVTATALVVQLPVRAVVSGWPPPGWVFVACDVGQGDALVLNAGPHSAVEVDDGPDPVAVDRCLRDLGVTDVALLVLTHYHLDHVGGTVGALHGRRLGAVMAGPLPEPVGGVALVRGALGAGGTGRTGGAGGAGGAGGTAVTSPAAGSAFDVGAVHLQVLGPAAPAQGTRSDPNNSSLVLLATVGGIRLLLPGDAEIEEQQALLAAGSALGADVLKVPHHGSAYSDPGFLAAVHARVAVISVGAGNDYGQPSPHLLSILDRLSVPAYRTDLDGDVAVCATAAGLSVVEHGRAATTAG